MGTAPSPTSATVGQKLTAAFWNTEVATALSFLSNPPLAVLRQNAAQSVNTATWTSITFDVEDIDRDGAHSTVTNTSRYTAQTNGWYLASGSVSWANSTTGRRIIRLSVNGVPVIGSAVGGGVPSVATAYNMHTSAVAFLNAGDYLELQGYQDSGGALALTNSTSEQDSRLHVLWVSK